MGFDFHEAGRPAVNAATCTGCGQCATICPDEVLSLEDGKARPGKGIFLGCIACGQCVAACPTESITVTGRGMTADDRIPLPPPESRPAAMPSRP